MVICTKNIVEEFVDTPAPALIITVGTADQSSRSLPASASTFVIVP